MSWFGNLANGIAGYLGFNGDNGNDNPQGNPPAQPNQNGNLGNRVVRVEVDMQKVIQILENEFMPLFHKSIDERMTPVELKAKLDQYPNTPEYLTARDIMAKQQLASLNSLNR